MVGKILGALLWPSSLVLAGCDIQDIELQVVVSLAGIFLFLIANILLIKDFEIELRDQRSGLKWKK